VPSEDFAEASDLVRWKFVLPFAVHNLAVHDRHVGIEAVGDHRTDIAAKRMKSFMNPLSSVER